MNIIQARRIKIFLQWFEARVTVNEPLFDSNKN